VIAGFLLGFVVGYVIVLLSAVCAAGDVEGR
jgi:hypothetical protein